MSKMIGIDLGSTQSRVAVMSPKGPVILDNELGEGVTPSAIAVAEDGHVLVGRAAKDRLAQVPESGVSCFKRDMGTPTTYTFGKRTWTPTECSACLLQELKRVAEVRLGAPVTHAVISVPAFFHDAQRRATLEAAHIAGLHVERLINEPTAVALAFAFAHPDREYQQVIVDLGGGTFDVTVLEVFDGVIDIQASAGESRLGGEDFTDVLVNRIGDTFAALGDPVERFHLRPQVEGLKRWLSLHETADITCDGRVLTITRAEMEEAAQSIIQRMSPVLRRCLRDAKVAPEALDEVILVGGASRMPLVRRLVLEELGRPPGDGYDTACEVVRGAALQAAICADDAAVSELVLTDVCPHTVGLEVAKELAPGQSVQGYFQPLIDRNTTIPFSRSRPFQTFHPTQDKIIVRVYQGERRMTKDNHLVGELRVEGLKHRAGQASPGQIDMCFSYDLNGLLDSEVTILSSGKKIRMAFEHCPGALDSIQVAEMTRRLHPHKVHPLDLPPNRARVERAMRIGKVLSDADRTRLNEALSQFEDALESRDRAADVAATRAFDNFLQASFSEDEA
jgi:molecular chaperone HscC